MNGERCCGLERRKEGGKGLERREGEDWRGGRERIGEEGGRGLERREGGNVKTWKSDGNGFWSQGIGAIQRELRILLFQRVYAREILKPHCHSSPPYFPKYPTKTYPP